MFFEPYKEDFRKMVSQLLYRHNYFRLRAKNQCQESEEDTNERSSMKIDGPN